MNMTSKRFILASIPAVILLAAGIRSVFIWDFAPFVEIFPYCGGYLAAYSGFETWRPSEQ